jgi:hypothetical protein
LEADASAFKEKEEEEVEEEEEVRHCVSCLISHLIPRHVFSFDFFLSLFEIIRQMIIL